MSSRASTATRPSSWRRQSGSTATTCCAGLRRHRGPILTVANWSGQWPGLVGMLNLNASLTKMGRAYSSIWSQDMTDDFADAAIGSWIDTGPIEHDTSHVRDLDVAALDSDAARDRPAPGGASWPSGWRSWVSSMKAAWACTTPSSMTST